mgnify:CR=1 FL=1
MTPIHWRCVVWVGVFLYCWYFALFAGCASAPPAGPPSPPITPPIDDTVPPIVLDPIRRPLPRLLTIGRRLVTDDSRPVVWRFSTGFRLLDYVADGNEPAAIAFLDWLQARGFNGARVLTTLCQSWFDLCPEDGQRALPRLLELAEERGLYLEVVALTGTKDQDKAAMASQVRAIGLICASHPACAGTEIANESSHPTQSEALQDESFVRTLVALIPNGVPVSSGSSCCGEPDEPPYPAHLTLGSYLTPHTDRSRDTWDRTRHLRELEALSADVGKYVVDDEPIGAGPVEQGGRRSSNPHEFFARGVLSRIFGVGATWHCEACLHSTIPSQIETEAADAFIAGTRIVPDDVTFTFKNASWADSPVKGFDFGDFGEPNTAVRAYSGVNGDTGVLALVGVTGNPAVEFQHGWRAGEVLADRPGIRVMAITRRLSDGKDDLYATTLRRLGL